MDEESFQHLLTSEGKQKRRQELFDRERHDAAPPEKVQTPHPGDCHCEWVAPPKEVCDYRGPWLGIQCVREAGHPGEHYCSGLLSELGGAPKEEPPISQALIRLYKAVQKDNVPVEVNSWDLAVVLNHLAEVPPPSDAAQPEEGCEVCIPDQEYFRCPQCGHEPIPILSRYAQPEDANDYLQAVDKFDACRAALARRYKADTGEEPTPPDNEPGEWHEWLIKQSDRFAHSEGTPVGQWQAMECLAGWFVMTVNPYRHFGGESTSWMTEAEAIVIRDELNRFMGDEE